jgi:predicted enzyme related to lactoylglutathione lyase
VQGVNFVGMSVSDADKTGNLLSDSVQLEFVQMESLKSDKTINLLTSRDTEVTASLFRSVNAQLVLFEFSKPSAEALQAPILDANGPGIAHVAFQTAKSTQTYQKFLQGGATHIGAEELSLNPRSHVAYGYLRDFDGTIIEVEHVDVEALELPAPPKNERRVRQVALSTTDMDRVVAFYSTLLETQNPRRLGGLFNLRGDLVDDVTGLPGAKIEMAWFQIRNLELEIIQYHEPETAALVEPRPFDAKGYNLIMFDVTDIEAARHQVLSAGGTIITGNEWFLDGETFFARDPDNNLLGFQTLSAQSPYSAKQFANNGLE